MRSFGFSVVILCGCGGDPSASVVNDWTAVKTPAEWGTFVDPDGDCKQTWKEGVLTIAVPGTPHELQLDGKRNAPRLVVDRTGDFAMSVRAAGKLAPQRSGGGKFYPYQGAGILIWQGDKGFVRMERAKIQTPNGDLAYINFETHDGGEHRSISQTKLGDDDVVYLRIERRGNAIVGLMSRDGAKWEKLGETTLGPSGAVKVGVAAVNNSGDAFTPEFGEVKFFEPKKAGGG